MSQQDLKIPTTEAEEAELFWKNNPSLANDAVVNPSNEGDFLVSGQEVSEYTKNLPTAAAKSILKKSPLRLLASVIDPPTLSPKGHDKSVIVDYATNPKRATFDKKKKRWFDVPVLAYSESNGRTIINDPILRRMNLDLWGINEKGQQGLIVDSKGYPVEFGHGTTHALKGSLDPDKTTSRSEFKGIYASTEQREYTKYMMRDGEFSKDSKVHKLFLRMYNPLRLTSPEGEEGMDSFVMNREDAEKVSAGLVNLRIQMADLNPNDPDDSFEVSRIKESYHLCERPSEVEEYLEHIGSDMGLTEFFQGLGYDGVLQQNAPHGESDYTEAILFEKGNVKSSTDNMGTFLENNDLYSKTQKKDSQKVS